MTFEDKLLLIKAGYTKSDIEAMEGTPNTATKPEPALTPKPEPTAPVTLTWEQLTQLINKSTAPTAPAPAPAPAPEPVPAPTPAPAAMTPEQYAQLLQAINRGNANIEMPPTNTETVENMLAGRLKSAFTSANREEENK